MRGAWLAPARAGWSSMDDDGGDSPTWRPSKKWHQKGSTAWVLVLVLVWYLSSVVTSLTTKAILMNFPYPITVATVQQAIAAVIGACTAQLERRASLADWRLHLRTFAPVAVPMVAALVRRAPIRPLAHGRAC